MDEQTVRRIVKQEVGMSNSQARFSQNPIQRHIHNGQDAPKISQNNVIPSGCVTGTITFAHVGTFLLKLNNSFTPSRIDIHGTVTGSGGKFMVTGLAILNPAFEFQPGTSSSVITGNLQFPRGTPEFPQGNVPIQTNVYCGVDGSGVFHTLVGDNSDHIAGVEYPQNTIHARMTVVGFSKSEIIVTVSDLDSGWQMNINYTIT